MEAICSLRCQALAMKDFGNWGVDLGSLADDSMVMWTMRHWVLRWRKTFESYDCMGRLSISIFSKSGSSGATCDDSCRCAKACLLLAAKLTHDDSCGGDK
jgi:hypothetical protein